MTVAALLSTIAKSSSLNAKKELLKSGDSPLLRQVTSCVAITPGAS
jgi:hypothetical protein